MTDFPSSPLYAMVLHGGTMENWTCNPTGQKEREDSFGTDEEGFGMFNHNPAQPNSFLDTWYIKNTPKIGNNQIIPKEIPYHRAWFSTKRVNIEYRMAIPVLSIFEFLHSDTHKIIYFYPSSLSTIIAALILLGPGQCPIAWHLLAHSIPWSLQKVSSPLSLPNRWLTGNEHGLRDARTIAVCFSPVTETAWVNAVVNRATFHVGGIVRACASDVGPAGGHARWGVETDTAGLVARAVTI